MFKDFEGEVGKPFPLSVGKACGLAIQIVLLFGLLATAAAQSYSFRIVDFPGAAETGLGGVNNSGDLVGFYAMTPDCCISTGFFLANGAYRVVAYPGALGTE